MDIKGNRLRNITLLFVFGFSSFFFISQSKDSVNSLPLDWGWGLNDDDDDEGNKDNEEEDEPGIIKFGNMKYRILSEVNREVECIGFIDPMEETVCSIPGDVVYEDNVYRVTDIAEDAFYNNESIIRVELPNSLLRIGDAAFCDCKNITDVIFSEGLISIGKGGFAGCESLSEIKLPLSLRSMDWSAFGKCTSLKEVVLPPNIDDIGMGAFTDCSSLESIVLPDNLETILNLTFWGCESLSSVKMPENLKRIENLAFADCTSLREIYLPATFEYMRGSAFANCYNLESFIVDEENPYFTAEGTVLYSKDKTVLVVCATPTSEVEVAEGVEVISKYAFSNSRNLKKLTFPSTTKKIATDAIFECEVLGKIFCLATTPPTLGSSDLFNIWYTSGGLRDVYVPAESLQLYKEAPEWKTHARYIRPIEDKNGVGEIMVDSDVTGDTVYKVYSIDGRHIMTTVDSENLKSLENGLYIINGKKQLIHR